MHAFIECNGFCFYHKCFPYFEVYFSMISALQLILTKTYVLPYLNML